MRGSEAATRPGAGWFGGLARRLKIAVTCACGLLAPVVGAADDPAIAATTAQPPAASVPAPQPSPHHESAIDRRVALLTAELGLDPAQQVEVRKILEIQRQQIMRIWGDASMPAAYRVSATQAISDNTGDRIRALLSDDQKRKYSKPRKPREPAQGPATPSLEDWMKATSSR